MGNGAKNPSATLGYCSICTYRWNIIHCAAVAMLSWLSLSAESRDITASSVYDILRISSLDSVENWVLSAMVEESWRSAEWIRWQSLMRKIKIWEERGGLVSKRLVYVCLSSRLRSARTFFPLNLLSTCVDQLQVLSARDDLYHAWKLRPDHKYFQNSRNNTNSEMQSQGVGAREGLEFANGLW